MKRACHRFSSMGLAFKGSGALPKVSSLRPKPRRLHEFYFPRDPGSPSENGFMEPKYLAFRRWLYTPCSSSDVRWARIPRVWRSWLELSSSLSFAPCGYKELVGVLPTDLEGKLPRTHEIHMHHWRKLQRFCDKERCCVDECVNYFFTSGWWRKFPPFIWGDWEVKIKSRMVR